MRCFVAIELADAVRRKLAEFQRRHAGLDRGVRWTRPEQIHLTLKFLGDVPDGEVAALCDAMTRAAATAPGPIELAVRQAGCFPPHGSARILWVGIDEPTGTLERLHRACEDAMAEQGYPPEGRRFSPHLTLARVKDPRVSAAVRAAARAAADFDAGRCSADQIVLFQSSLRPHGAVYAVVTRAFLGPPR